MAALPSGGLTVGVVNDVSRVNVRDYVDGFLDTADPSVHHSAEPRTAPRQATSSI